MKRVSILLVIAVTWAVLVHGGLLHAAEDPILSAGFKPINKVPAPGFSMEDVGGKRVKLEDFQGKVVLLFFWATW